jgi:Sec-independent protein translocase protein TatA
MPIGPLELGLGVLVVLMLAGPSRVMRLGSRMSGSVRRSVREFRDAATNSGSGPRGG